MDEIVEAVNRRKDLSILIGGDAGQGVESGGAGLARAFARGGLHVFGVPDYRSRIRGGHNFYVIRLSERPVYSRRSDVQLMLALTEETVELHRDEVSEGGAVLYPDHFNVDEAALRQRSLRPFPLPLLDIAREKGSRLMVNTAALAAAAGVVGWPLAHLERVIAESFDAKGKDIVDQNVAVAWAAFEVGRERYGRDLPLQVEPLEAPPRLLMNGNQALSLGAVAAGCRFMAAYPMTPATTIIEQLSALPPELGVVTKHAEDEIAAVCMAIGASYAGARSMTATSGGGFCLMVEAMGLAGMTEVPVVIVNAQRGGPSTGLPTRTEQGDLLFAINAGQGEFPRIVLAPATVEECFEAGWRAFNLADKYQCPVVVLTDQLLAGSLRTVDREAVDFSAAQIDRGDMVVGGEADRLPDGYKRFELTASGVSPRAVPGHPKTVFPSSSDEHDEYGHIVEDADNRRRMLEKRMRKLETASSEMRGPRLYGPPDAELTLVTWGSTYGPCRQAVDILNADAARANLLCFSDLWPFPERETAEALDACRRTVSVEQNYTSQLARLIRMTTGRSMDGAINKYNGRPFTPEEIIAALE